MRSIASLRRHKRLGGNALLREFSDDVVKEIMKFLHGMLPYVTHVIVCSKMRCVARLFKLVCATDLRAYGSCARARARVCHWCAAWDKRYVNWNVSLYPEHNAVDINGGHKGTVIATTFVAFYVLACRPTCMHAM